MTDDTARHPETVWERLRANREHNTPIFFRAGVRPELAREVDCPSCGAQESALFWSVTRTKEKELHLLCPVCETGTARYGLTGKRPARHPAMMAALSAAALLGTAATVLLIRETSRAGAERNAREVLVEWYDGGASLASATVDRLWGMVPGVDPATALPSSTPTSSGSGSVSFGRVNTSSVRQPGAVPVAASAPREAPRSSNTPAPLEAQPAEAADLSYLARGDRRRDLDLIKAGVLERSGPREAQLLLRVEYDVDRNETLAVLDARSTEWPRRLTFWRGWRRVVE